ncbi:phosphodiesterase [Streptomyces sp. Wb2n-11]|uniref:phosphodiesterase n=1 Tax=Streptomyces sp. Wb2n-11 TaxID=1030533 RepID=UPI000A7DADD8|nr:phosphodiesterase [Streptomyces sp. Wb2n-11]
MSSHTQRTATNDRGEPRPWPWVVARWVAELRKGPALHPHGVTGAATLEVHANEQWWGEPWLDRPGRYPALVRWSRAAGLPGRLPDGLGLAVRVVDAGGPGRPLDLLFTTSGGGRWMRHVPLPRRHALAGPYSTLLAYQVGDRPRVLAAAPSADAPAVRSDLDALRTALRHTPLSFELCAAGPREPWRRFATLTTHSTQGTPPEAVPAYDPYLNHLPRLHPTPRLSGLREAAYRGSRTGRGARPHR